MQNFMQKFMFNVPTKVLFGVGQLSGLHKQILPGRKALIVTSDGTSVKKYDYLERLKRELDLVGVAYEVFDETSPNPTKKSVVAGARATKENGCDFVLTLGGGSVMNTGKCIAMMASMPSSMWGCSVSKVDNKNNSNVDAIPMVSILLPHVPLAA